MKHRVKYPALAILLVLAGGASHVVIAGDSQKATVQQFNETTSYTWYDGNRKRTIWRSPDLVAVFAAKPVGREQAKALAASATRIDGKLAHMQLWRLKAGDTGTAGMQRLQRTIPGEKISPVFHDGPSTSGRKRALPGNIIVHLDPNWDRQQVEAWFKQQSLAMIKPLHIGPNIFLVKTGPGLAALEKANEIYSSGTVIAAYPDWWQEVSKR